MDNKKTGVLVIDDNEVVRNLAKMLLTNNGFNVLAAEGGREAIELLKLFDPHVILLDVMMPDMDGHEVCRKLKTIDKTKDIPIIMVTSKADTIDKIKGLEIGAADYITKPFNHAELLARVTTQVKMKNICDELQEKNIILEELVKKDGLTNLYNHRYFHERLNDEFVRAKRYNLPLCCVILDIDYFKRVNDQYGHQFGDLVLKSMSEIIIENIRDADICARYGGEEFGIIIPHTTIEETGSMMERIRENIEKHKFEIVDKSISITISIGIAGMRQSGASTHRELVKYADEALYNAKFNGRNRVEIYNKD